MHAFHCLNHSITLSLFQSILSHFFYLSVSLSSSFSCFCELRRRSCSRRSQIGGKYVSRQIREQTPHNPSLSRALLPSRHSCLTRNTFFGRKRSYKGANSSLTSCCCSSALRPKHIFVGIKQVAYNCLSL